MRQRRTISGSGFRPLVLLVSLGLAACSDPPPRSPPAQVRRPDQPRTQNLRVDEAGMTGQVEGGFIKVKIPIATDERQATTGSLNISLVEVDGSRTLTLQRASFQLAAAGSAVVAVDLAVPREIAEQADWAKVSLHVDSPQALALRVTRSLLSVLTPYEVRLEGPATVTRGRSVRYRVRVQDPLGYRALAGVPVELVVRKDGEPVATFERMTSDKGDAVFEVTLQVDGPVKVEARARSQGTAALVADDATVEVPGGKVLLTTDKPLYQPGQTIHLRALALDRASGKPLAGKPVLFEIEDGKGNKIAKISRQSDGYGLGSATFKLGPVLNMGTFKVRVAVGPDQTEKTVEVGRYVLPKFKVAVKTERPFYTPGEVINGTVEARYFFGKPVAQGTVTVEAGALDIGETVFERVVGKTDAEGRFSFALTLPAQLVGLPLEQGSALVNLRAKVQDTALQEVQQERPVTVAGKALRLALVPESTVLVPGLDNRLDLFVTDPLGGPVANAAVELSPAPGEVEQGRTDAFGHAVFSYTPPAGRGESVVAVRATASDGQSASEQFPLGAQAGAAHLLVRSDRAVYGLGDTVSVEVRTSSARSLVYVDWVNNGQLVDMRTLEVQDGVGRFQTTLDTSLMGTSRIEAYIVGSDGNIVRAGRTIFARQDGGLQVEVTPGQPQYTPGSRAQLTFSVKDEAGAPAVAALGVHIVDEAVFALSGARPDLLRTYFELEEKFAEPHYQIRAPAGNLSQLLFSDTAQKDPAAAGAAQTRAAATLAALGEVSMMGISRGSWAVVPPAIAQRLEPYYQAERQRLLPVVNLAVAVALPQLQARGCGPEQYICSSIGKTFWQALSEEVRSSLMVYDFWGNRYRDDGTEYNQVVRFATDGPDEKAKTGDDHEIVFQPWEITLPSRQGYADAGAAFPPGFPVPSPAPPAPPAAQAPGQPPPPVGAPPTEPPAPGGGAAEPRVRQQFPETLYVNPQLITGADGKATIDLDLADSITDWRVSSVAHTLGGKLGGGVGALRVFQDFFVDIDFPATLTRGDELDFPVAVYNYLGEPQTIHVELPEAPWFTPRGRTSFDLTLAPGQVTGVRFPVRVTQVGRQSLTVKGLGGQRSDAVARSVLVQPDGKEVAVTRAGSLGPGTITETVTFPDSAVAGSPALVLSVFPAYLSQVVQGMDSLLRVPNGCFEQTTSTAWPNVLVTDYLKQTNQLKPEIGLKAEALMSAGYQRLLTFEHRGGGFSWFGEQDGKPFLSVTAFGLMEFADMAKVHPVDPAMLERTRRWLAGQQSADGSWPGDQSEFFSFHTSLVRNSAFVVWALASADYQGEEIARGLEYVKKASGQEKLDAYSLGIVANAFLTAAPGDPFAAQVLAQLDALKKEEGDKTSWDSGGTQTSFYGGGQDGAVATTALAAHALLLAGGHKATVDRALAFLTGQLDKDGNYGSTQATIWTLRTLLLASRKGTEGAVGSFTVELDGAPFATVMMTADQADVMTTVDLGSSATTGAHQIKLGFAGTGKVSYNLVARHHVPWQTMPAAPEGPLSVAVSYDKTSLPLEATATASVVVRNNTARPQDMILVTVGLPPGFQVNTDDLDQYKQQQVLSAYELTGKQILLYLPGLPARTARTIRYRLQAVMPVRAADGGAEAFLYYEPAQRAVARATTLEVVGP